MGATEKLAATFHPLPAPVPQTPDLETLLTGGTMTHLFPQFYGGYIAECSECDAKLVVGSLGDRIEHRWSGSHEFIPHPARASSDSGSKRG